MKYVLDSSVAVKWVISEADSGRAIRLRDEYGHTGRGTAEKAADGSFHYTFRNNRGKTVSGLADGFGITLRDEKGKTWRGFID